MSDRVLALPYREIWCVDTEYRDDGFEIICIEAHEIRSNRRVSLWQGEFPDTPPYCTGPDDVMVCYAANAELGTHLTLGWPLPAHVLDLNAEFRVVAGGRRGGKWGLLDALMFYGLPTISPQRKKAMQNRALQGGSWTLQERYEMQEYCYGDVVDLIKLLPFILADAARLLKYADPAMYLRHADFRGRFMCANARNERRGIPFNLPIFQSMTKHWGDLIHRTIAANDKYGLYDDTDTFKEARFEQLIADWGIPWPRLAPTKEGRPGKLKLDGRGAKNTFSDMAKLDPRIRDIHELRKTRAMLRGTQMKVRADGRAYANLWAFGSKTGRTQPNAREYVFSPAKWFRFLIKPARGRALAYLDFTAQEFAIAADRSKDPNMLQAYASGDPHEQFAIMAGALKPVAGELEPSELKARKSVRNMYKATNLGSLYGMGEQTLTQNIQQPMWTARSLRARHRTTFATYWAWSRDVINNAARLGYIHTSFGWWFHIGGTIPRRTLMNWPMQAHGADIMRVVCVLADKYGIEVVATVHDGFMIEADDSEIEAKVALMREIMRRASRIVLGGFEIRVDCKPIRWPDTYVDDDGSEMWREIMRLLKEIEDGEG